MNRSGILDGLWRAWPVMSWLLPVLFSAHGLFATFGGWAWSFLLLTAPILIPACGLLGMWPYRMLRRSGHDTVPWRIGVLLPVTWWAAFAAILLAIDTLSRQSAAESVPSLLRLLGSAAPGIGYELGTMVCALAIAVASWAAIWTFARAASAASPERTAPRRGVIAVRVVMIALPLLLVAVIAAGSLTTRAPRDSAGDTAADVRGEPVAVQAQQALLRYEGFQQRIAEVRELIADQGWQATPPFGLDSSRPECGGEGPRCYGFLGRYRIDASGPAVDLDAVGAVLAETGWAVEERMAPHGAGLVVTRADGVRIELGVRDGAIDLRARSAWWWGDADAVREALPEAGPPGAALLAADEWPPLPR